MLFGRSAKIYGIIFSSTVVFLLIFAGATHFAYQKQISQVNEELMRVMNITFSSHEHHTVHHNTIKRVIYGETILPQNSDVADVGMEKSWLLVLNVDDYGLPMTVLAMYDNNGLLKNVKVKNDHPLGVMDEVDFVKYYKLFHQNGQVEPFVYQGIMNALRLGSEYVQKQGSVNEK